MARVEPRNFLIFVDAYSVSSLIFVFFFSVHAQTHTHRTSCYPAMLLHICIIPLHGTPDKPRLASSGADQGCGTFGRHIFPVLLADDPTFSSGPPLAAHFRTRGGEGGGGSAKVAVPILVQCPSYSTVLSDDSSFFRTMSDRKCDDRSYMEKSTPGKTEPQSGFLSH